MENPWITAKECARRLQVHHNTIGRILDASNIRRRVLPGTFPRYHADDVAALQAEAIQGEAREKARATG